jgi:hypothetical protein
MVEKNTNNIINNELFFKMSPYYEKTQDNIQNQSTEILATEEIFIKQKEEIKKIKKKRLELKAFKQDNIMKAIKNTNFKCIQILKQGQKFNTYNAIKTETQKPERKAMKSNSINQRMIGDRKKKFLNKEIKRVKLKLNNDFKNNISNNNNNITNTEEENTIINYDNDITINFENEIDCISLNNLDYFQICDCIVNENNNNDINNNDKLPKINEKWTKLNNNISNIRKKINSNLNKILQMPIPNILKNNFDLSKKVLRTKNYVDYNTKGVKINLNLKIFDEGIFYIFTRCYIDNYYTEEIKEVKKYKTITTNHVRNNKTNIFSTCSTVIKIYKNKNSNKGFVSFGTFYKNKKSGNLHYKNFLNRQLVDFVHNDKDYYYLENDLCEFNIIIIDTGNEYIQAKISLNNKDKYNYIKSNFYLPLNKKAKIMFCGEGNNIKIDELNIKSFIKYDEDRERIGLIISDEKKNCECCNIF